VVPRDTPAASLLGVRGASLLGVMALFLTMTVSIFKERSTRPESHLTAQVEWDASSELAKCQERCPARQKSRVERLKAKVEPLLT